MIGTIPILIHSVVDDAYKHLPVAFIDNYKDFFAKPNETIAKLNQWIAELGPYYEPGSELRKKTLQVCYNLKINYLLFINNIYLFYTALNY